MSEAKHTGGPATVVFHHRGELQAISLRDWFAGQALAGNWSGRESDKEYDSTVERVAANAYRIADAMLAARERKP
jgi:hypothetical protein